MSGEVLNEHPCMIVIRGNATNAKLDTEISSCDSGGLAGFAIRTMRPNYKKRQGLSNILNRFKQISWK